VTFRTSRTLRAIGARHRAAVTSPDRSWRLRGHRDEFTTALASCSIWTLLVAMVLQIVALVARSEAWHGCVGAAGGTVPRRVLYRASSMGAVGTLGRAEHRPAPRWCCAPGASCGRGSPSYAARAGAGGWSRSCSSRGPRRSRATGSCCTPSARTRRCSTRSPS
jgi:hypothetical protein